MNKNYLKKGMTLLEIVIVVAIITIIVSSVGSFYSNIFSFNKILRSGLQTQSEIKKVIRPFAGEVRSASPSSAGAFPIEEANPLSFVFFSDVNSDGKKEKIKYYLEGTDFKKSVIIPTGSPLSYSIDDQKITEIIHNVKATNTIFYYYGSGYDGATSSLPLSNPVTPSDVRLVKIEFYVDDDPNQAPGPVYVKTEASIRNLKDNL